MVVSLKYEEKISLGQTYLVNRFNLKHKHELGILKMFGILSFWK